MSIEIEAVAAPEGSYCAKHPATPGIFVCSRCGDYACHHCTAIANREAYCQGCANQPLELPETWPARLRFLYLSIDGRIDRRTWWLMFYLPTTLLYATVVVLEYFATTRGDHAIEVAENLGLIVVAWPSFAACTKRLHDRNQSAWWLLPTLVPLIGSFWFLINLGFLRGDAAPNDYGPPLAAPGGAGPHHT